MAVSAPDPIEFTLDAAELRRIRRGQRRANGIVTWPIIAMGTLLQTANPLILIYRHHGHDIVAWILLGLIIGILALAVIFGLRQTTWLDGLNSPGVVTHVRFDDRALTIEGGRRARDVRSVRIETISSVSTSADALVLSKRTLPLLIVPRRAFPDGGEHAMRYFEDRLVGKRMLRRSSPRTNIVNTVTR